MENTLFQSITDCSFKKILADGTVCHVEQCSQRRCDIESGATFNLIRLEHGFVEYASAGNLFSKTGRDREVNPARHHVAKFMDCQSCFMRNSRLDFASLIAAPKRPTDQVFVFTFGVGTQAVDSMIYLFPIASILVVMVLPVGIAD